MMADVKQAQGSLTRGLWGLSRGHAMCMRDVCVCGGGGGLICVCVCMYIYI